MNTVTTRVPGADLPSSGPWWRHPMMWLVVGGPAIVVVASIATLTLAVTYPDPVVQHQANSEQGRAAEDSTETVRPPPAALEPAMKARNHAATGGQVN
ncbi:hypothetical protein CDN99_10445 [Roseateles aquatilis]|uniref:Nitrogen fixation protein FixH n=1 Tax=Roseateles aquatilis TaxID=431061 RepID=A0A246JG25_9BURK|nr:hypothetical protein [Roseateles aquatilis]OWQ91552.1 hypothetical protein CDN99_10445 [Roseateles aquatilis]